MRAPTRRIRWTIRLSRFVTQSLGVRFLVALGLSALVWAGLTLELNPNAQELFNDNVPVDDVNLGPDLVLLSSIEPVRVSVQGPRVNLERLTVRDFVARVDLASAKPGDQQLPVQVQVSDPAVEVVRVTPENVTVVLDRLDTRQFPIVARVDSAPAAGFRADIGAISAQPASVMITGPTSILTRVAAVQATVSLEGATRVVSTQSLLVPVDRQSEEVADVQVNPQTAQITIPVTRITSRKRVPVLAQLEGEVAPGFFLSRISVVPTTVEIEGQPEDLERVEALRTQPLDIGGARGDIELEVGFVREPGVTIASDQTLARVSVVVEPLEDSTTIQVAVLLLNLSSGLQALSEPPALQLVVAGPAEVLQQLQGGDVVAEVDLRNRAPGLHQIRPVISVPPGLRAVQVTPPLVTVRISLAEAEVSLSPAAIIGPGGAVPTPTPTRAPTPTPTPTPARTPRSNMFPGEPIPPEG